MKKTIRISSAIILNSNNELLVVRKCNSSFYMLPGGKIEENESLIDALIRELKEELGLEFKGCDFTFLGVHETDAVNEPATIVQGNIFLLKTPLSVDKIANYAEIEEICWVAKSNYKEYQLAHLLQEFALPRWLADFQ